jgi:hypothetical protein
MPCVSRFSVSSPCSGSPRAPRRPWLRRLRPRRRLARRDSSRPISPPPCPIPRVPPPTWCATPTACRARSWPSPASPGAKIADLIPGGGYFTRIFSKAVGPKGHVYAYVPDELTKLAKREPAVNAIARDPAYKNVTVVLNTLPNFSTPEKLDLVFTAQNYHDMHDKFMGPADLSAVNKPDLQAR